jgi:serine/threonine-protein kinase
MPPKTPDPEETLSLLPAASRAVPSGVHTAETLPVGGLAVDPALSFLNERLLAEGVDQQAKVDATIRPPLEEPGDPADPAEGSGLGHVDLSSLQSVQYGSQSDPENADLELVSVLGEGGMGRVELAWQRDLEREVAVKRVRSGGPNHPAVKALLDEARITGRLEHPNIVPVHRLARSGDDPLMVMKRIEGVPWRDLIKDPGLDVWASDEQEPLMRHLNVLVQLCHAVQFAHSRGVLHRDLKPDNVMVGAFGEVYLLDWGVALRLDLQDQVKPLLMGTPAYMPPEMAMCAGLDVRADVFLLGACLHEVLTGRPPHSGDTLAETLLCALAAEPVVYGPDVDGELAAIANRAMAADRNHRFSSAAAFRASIQGYMRHRASAQLCADAVDCAAKLAPLVEGDLPRTTEDQRQIQELFDRSRLGFQAALRDWPGNLVASEALTGLIELMVGYELRRNAFDTAERLLDALPSPRQDLRDLISHHREQFELQDSAQLELESLRKDYSLRTATWTHSVFIVLHGVVWAAVAIAWSAVLRRGGPFAPLEMLLMQGVGTFMVLVAVVAMQYSWLETQIRRRFVYGMGVYLGALFINRWLVWVRDVPYESSLITDHLILLVFMGMLASVVRSLMWWAVLACLLSLVAAGFWPEHTFDFVAAVLLLANLLFAWLVRPLTGREGDLLGPDLE